MAQNHDELAAALDALSRGEAPATPPATPPIAPPQRSASPSAPQPRSAVPPPASPVRPAAPVRAAAPTARPAVPAAPAIAAGDTAREEPAARPAAPSRPIAPAAAERADEPPARPATPRAARPSAPNLSPPPAAPAAPPVATPQSLEDIVFDEDDNIGVPEVAHTGPKRQVKAAPRPSVMKTLHAKQTLIPILLTLGVIAIISAAVPFVVAADSPMGGLKDQPLMIGGLALVGVLLLAVAGMNMAQVASALKLDASR